MNVCIRNDRRPVLIMATEPNTFNLYKVLNIATMAEICNSLYPRSKYARKSNYVFIIWSVQCTSTYVPKFFNFALKLVVVANYADERAQDDEEKKK